ncbi:hypothetical protein [Ensifer aridi]|uniref:hypothetical protein n=1 Tax=Ensifer aridi TaxID=1708715 RepID=UPI00359025F1
MFAYAEETGNSGPNVFDEDEYFRLGAILTVDDIAPAVDAVFSLFLAEKSIDSFILTIGRKKKLRNSATRYSTQ